MFYTHTGKWWTGNDLHLMCFCFFFTSSWASRWGCWFLWRSGHWRENEIFIIYNSTWWICVNVYLYFAFLKHWMIGFISDWPGLSPSPSRASAKLKSWHETLGKKTKNKKHKNHTFYADTIKQDMGQRFIANVEARLSSLMFVLLMYDDTCHVYIDVLHSCQVLQW